MTGVGLSIVNFLKSLADRIGGNEQSISCQDADQTLIRIILFAMQCRSGNFRRSRIFLRCPPSECAEPGVDLAASCPPFLP
jgi:hypothetical protein